MRLGMHTGIAHAQAQSADGSWEVHEGAEAIAKVLGAIDDAHELAIATAELQRIQAAQSAKRGASSQKGPVPKRSPEQRKGKQVELPPDDDEPEETSEQRIARLAQSRYEESAAIDAAAALAFVTRGKPMLKGNALEAKRRIKLTPEVWEEIVIRVAEGESLYKVCEDDHIPHRTQIYKHLRDDAQMRTDYDVAVLLQSDKRAEQIVELSEQARVRAAMGASTEEINAIKMLVNSLQWVSARLNPKKWGDKQAIDLNANVKLTPDQVNGRLAALVAKAQRKRDEPTGGSDAGGTG